jgi:hypothetical protein
MLRTRAGKFQLYKLIAKSKNSAHGRFRKSGNDRLVKHQKIFILQKKKLLGSNTTPATG